MFYCENCVNQHKTGKCFNQHKHYQGILCTCICNWDDEFVLTGDNAIAFEKYNNTPATEEEIKQMEEATKYFEEHDVETIENKKNRGITERLQSKIKNIQDQIEVAIKEDIQDIEEFKLKERLKDLMEIRDNI